MFKEKLLKNALRVFAGEHVLKRVLSHGNQAFLCDWQVEELTLMYVEPQFFNANSLSPKHFYESANFYASIITRSVMDSGGMVCNFSGNAVLASWDGADSVDRAERSVRCGLQIVEAFRNASGKFKCFGIDQVKPNIGIHAGVVVIGNVGDVNRMSYSIMGNPVNLSTLLSAMCQKFDGVSIVASDVAMENISHKFTLQELGPFKVKGVEIKCNLFSVEGWHASWVE